MNLTKQSHLIMSFFIENNCIPLVKQTNKTDHTFKKLYQEIHHADNIIQNLKKQQGDLFYKLKITDIQNVNQIPKPQTFPSNGFPVSIRKHIDETSLKELSYSIYFINRSIHILFIVEDNNIELHIEKYNEYVDKMLMWLFIIDSYASRKCAKELTIYIYHTQLTKLLPTSNIHILNENNVNTAFTMTCPKISEIVVFRREEWFKVFLHETFHNFGLDFSDMNNQLCTSKMLSIFPVKSEVNLYEAYSEFWAKIMNVLFCSYIHTKNKKDMEEFLTNTEFFIHFERMYCFFQAVKVLHFMGLKYNDLYEKNQYSKNSRNTLYKEQTNVLAYYIITLVLLNNYQSFLQWCETNNTSLLQFKKTITNQQSLCKFIETKHKTKHLLDGIQCTEKLFSMLNHTKFSKKHSQPNEINYLLHNLRMSVCELG